MRLETEARKSIEKLQVPLFSKRSIKSSSIISEQKRNLRLLLTRAEKFRSKFIVRNPQFSKMLALISELCPEGASYLLPGSCPYKPCRRCSLRALRAWRTNVVEISLLKKKLNKALKDIEKAEGA